MICRWVVFRTLHDDSNHYRLMWYVTLLITRLIISRPRIFIRIITI